MKVMVQVGCVYIFKVRLEFRLSGIKLSKPEEKLVLPFRAKVKNDYSVP